MFIANHTEKAQIRNYSGWLSRGQLIKDSQDFQKCLGHFQLCACCRRYPTAPPIRLPEDSPNMPWICSYDAYLGVFSVIGDKHLEESRSPGTSAFSLVRLEHCVIRPHPPPAHLHMRRKSSPVHMHRKRF